MNFFIDSDIMMPVTVVFTRLVVRAFRFSHQLQIVNKGFYTTQSNLKFYRLSESEQVKKNRKKRIGLGVIVSNF